MPLNAFIKQERMKIGCVSILHRKFRKEEQKRLEEGTRRYEGRDSAPYFSPRSRKQPEPFRCPRVRADASSSQSLKHHSYVKGFNTLQRVPVRVKPKLLSRNSYDSIWE